MAHTKDEFWIGVLDDDHDDEDDADQHEDAFRLTGDKHKKIQKRPERNHTKYSKACSNIQFHFTGWICLFFFLLTKK